MSSAATQDSTLTLQLVCARPAPPTATLVSMAQHVLPAMRASAFQAEFASPPMPAQPVWSSTTETASPAAPKATATATGSA